MQSTVTSIFVQTCVSYYIFNIIYIITSFWIVSNSVANLGILSPNLATFSLLLRLLLIFWDKELF